MTRLNNSKISESRLVPILVLCLAISVIVIIPLKITGLGYLPSDDALRHAGKVLSGKDWSGILLLRDGVKMDSHPGWHAILTLIHETTGWGADSLVVFSVIFLFVLFCAIPILLLERPEAWLAAMLAATVIQSNLVWRLFLGRPYILTMAVVLVFCLLWNRLREKATPYAVSAVLTLLVAASTWIHCAWYLFALPLISLCIAREWRALYRFGVILVLGITLGSLLTGHPHLFIKQTLSHAFQAFNNHSLQRMLVSEFQPFAGDGLIVMLVLFTLAWRKIRGAWNAKVINNPVFILAVTGWVLGFISRRFWLDWGMPAICVWMAFEFEETFEKYFSLISFRRLFLTFAILGVFYLSITSDVGGRWTNNLTKEYLSSGNPEQTKWLPEAMGIVYADDMGVFYDTFFKNPKAPWRYALGFEPAMMPPEDLAVFRKIQWNFGDDKSFGPWVEKMRPEDRLILRRSKASPPGISGLEWYYAATGTWVGRIPKK